MGKRVAIIGAGAAGLTSIKCAIDAGLEPTAYEKDSWLGGIWNYTEEQHRFVAPKSTVVNISKHCSCYSDYPMAKEMPNYPTGKLFQHYFESYAKEFDLTRRIRFDCEVLKVEECKDYEETGKWEVHSIRKNQDKEQDVCVEEYDFILVCSGVYAKPFIPDIPGLEDYTGRLTHSREYKTFKGFKGKSVVVVGSGNSAGDIACELSRVAKQVYISIRSGKYIVSRMATGGWPLDLMFLKRSVQSIPKTILQWLKKRSLLSSSYNLANLGLQPDPSKKTDYLLINDEVPHRIVTGTLIAKDEIIGFKDKKLFFKDNTELDDIDEVIFATGYDIEFPFLSPSVFNSEKAKQGHQLYKAVFPLNLSKLTLAFIGAFRALGPIIPLCEIQARWAVEVFQGRFTLPRKEVMKEEVAAKRQVSPTKCASSSLQLLSEGYIAYMDDIGSSMGVKPNLWKLFLQDPLLAIKCFFGPAVPAQYRLMGPGAWPGAKQAIEEFEENLLTPLKTRQVNGSAKSSSTYIWLFVCSVIVLIISIFIYSK